MSKGMRGFNDISPEPLTGDLIIALEGIRAEDAYWSAALEAGVTAFAAAVSKGAYGEAARATLLASEHQPPLFWRMHLLDLPAHALACLEGMLRYRLTGAPVRLQLAASLNGEQAFGRPITAPAPEGSPFTIDIAIPSGAAPPLTIMIQSGVPMLRDHIERLSSSLETWRELVLGGYPAAGEELGASSIGPVWIRQITPTLLLLNSEHFRGSVGAFDPLMGVLHHRAELGIRHIVVE
jgi:hypothetical protein